MNSNHYKTRGKQDKGCISRMMHMRKVINETSGDRDERKKKNYFFLSSSDGINHVEHQASRDTLI